MGRLSRRRHLERIIKRSAPKPAFDNGIRDVKLPKIRAPRIKRSFKVFAIFGWIAVGIAWLASWVDCGATSVPYGPIARKQCATWYIGYDPRRVH